MGFAPSEFYEMTFAEVALIVKGHNRQFDSAQIPAHDDRPEVDPAEMVAAMIKGANGN